MTITLKMTFSVRREFGWEFNVVVTLNNMKAHILLKKWPWLDMCLRKTATRFGRVFQSVTAQIKGILYHE